MAHSWDYGFDVDLGRSTLGKRESVRRDRSVPESEAPPRARISNT